MTPYDIAVIGGGPGGYSCALRAAKLGLSVALVDERDALGGTCLNIGCIPSKALLHSTALLSEMQDDAAMNGILLAGIPSMSIQTMMQKKAGVVSRLNGGVALLCKQAKVTVLKGKGKLLGSGKISIEGAEPSEIEAKNIVLATGSQPVELPSLPFDGSTIVSSTEALSFDTPPARLVIIGAGAIGLELGSVWSRLGSEVTFLEFLPQIAPTFDTDVARTAERLLTKQGMTFHLGAKVTGATVNTIGVATVTVDKAGQTLSFDAEKVLVCVGRKPNYSGLNLEAAGVELDSRLRIAVDAELRTKAANIWAVGDIVPGPMLAHKAEAEGKAVAERIAGHVELPIDADLVPGVVYTNPEMASVGITEKTAKERGLDVKIGKSFYMANGRAVSSDATDGFAKVISDAKTDRLLGVQIVGASASEIIGEAAAHMVYGGSAEDIALTVHAHPTLSEVLRAAAEQRV
jgi:dihydrolipoamide dehydrogenase